jgi:hypothetical protein
MILFSLSLSDAIRNETKEASEKKPGGGSPSPPGPEERMPVLVLSNKFIAKEIATGQNEILVCEFFEIEVDPIANLVRP